MLLEEGLDTGPILLQQRDCDRPGTDCGGSVRRAGEGRCAACGGDAGRPGRRHDQAEAAGSRAGDACAAARARRWAHGLCGAHGDGTLESLARISAVAGGVHRPRRQEAHLSIACVLLLRNVDWPPRRSLATVAFRRTSGFCVACAQSTWLEIARAATRRQEAHGSCGVSARARGCVPERGWVEADGCSFSSAPGRICDPESDRARAKRILTICCAAKMSRLFLRRTAI